MIRLFSEKPEARSADLMAIPVFEDGKGYSEPLFDQVVESAKTWKEFCGKDGETLILYQLEGFRAKRIMLVGLGETDRADLEKVRRFSGRVAGECVKRQLKGRKRVLKLQE